MNYLLFPFTFKLFDNSSVLMVNDAGEYQFIDLSDFEQLMSYSLSDNTFIYQDLKSKQFIADSNLELPIEMLSVKYRSRKSFLSNFTSLHMMVITLRCNHRCEYCQVSSESPEAYKYDMPPETAKKIVDSIFCSPSNYIKIEFQGGEPLLNWKTIETTINYSKELNKIYQKKLEFVICTNLTLIDNEKIDFINEHNVSISTSLDGPKNIHDQNRILRVGGSSYDLFHSKLSLCKDNIKHFNVSALMTTSINNIYKFKEVIDEYIKFGFEGIFFRSLNPYGLAKKQANKLSYPVAKFLKAYEEGLNYIIEINISGTRFVEYYTSLLFRRIMTPFSTGFVDLQSPSGAGISGVIYDYNGDVYPADEARMLSRMGDKYFLLGNVNKKKYLEIFNGDKIQNIVKNSCVETLPQCSSCVYQAYCGVDPIRNYLERKDLVGHRPTSSFCKKHIGLFDILFRKIRNNNPEEMNVLWSWITNRNISN